MKVFGIYSAVLMVLTLAACGLLIDGRLQIAERAPTGTQVAVEAKPFVAVAAANTPRVQPSR